MKVFQKKSDLLDGLGEGPVTEDTFKAVERFICLLYNIPSHIESVNEARCLLFPKATSSSMLPPTSDALRFHIKRCHFQSMVWLQACIAQMELEDPRSNSWKLSDGKLLPGLMSLDPIPVSCLEIITCQCTKGCGTLRCKCKKSKLCCTGACRCISQGGLCLNS